MSMYDIMTGGPIGPVVQLVFSLLGLSRDQARGIPRFRDAYLALGDDGAPRIGILTRTGGANRESYPEGNALMETFPDFIETMDLDIDETYALWEYAVPTEFASEIVAGVERFKARKVPMHPRDKMEAGLQRMKAGHIPEELKQVIAATDAVAAGDEEALKATGVNVRKESLMSEDGVGPDITIIEL